MAKREVSLGVVEVLYTEFDLDIVASKNVCHKKYHYVSIGYHAELAVFVRILAAKNRRDVEQVQIYVTDHLHNSLVGKEPVVVTGAHGVRKFLRRFLNGVQRRHKQPRVRNKNSLAA